jgi:hypothetical protein
MTFAVFAVVPALLLGQWSIEPAYSCAPGNGAITFGSEGVELGGAAATSCSYRGIATQHARRWYVDLRCRDGAIVEYDVNHLVDGDILIARRPLGEAARYRRCN